MGSQTGSFRDVHATVLRQHTELRARLRALDGASASASSAVAAAFQRISLLRLAMNVEAHLLFEEVEVAPRLRRLDVWGLEREALMRAEHALQRSRIEHACLIAEESQGGLELAQCVSALVVGLLEDMAREEHDLVTLERLEDDGLSDQMTGRAHHER